MLHISVIYIMLTSATSFYCNLVDRFRKNMGKFNFSEQFRKLINRFALLWFNKWFSSVAGSVCRVSQEYSSLLDHLIFVLSL